MTTYTLHYAPDNASLIIRMVLEELRVPYSVVLVDRQSKAQHSAAYRSLNPVGRIPALETPDGPMFETAAIGLWLADRHRDTISLSPAPNAAERGSFLSWLFFLSNTVHAELRTLFYPGTIVGPDERAQACLAVQTQTNLTRHFDILNAACNTQPHFGQDAITFCDLYIAALLRWPALYPVDADKAWLTLSRWPALAQLARRIELRDSAVSVARAEGLGPTPFSSPDLPNPPEGSAL